MILCQNHTKRPVFRQKGYTIETVGKIVGKKRLHRNLSLFRQYFLPLHALIRKYPYGVMSEKERWTTGLVCPLHVRGICLAMFPNLNKLYSVKMKNPSRRPKMELKFVTQMNADSYYRRRFRAQDFLKGDVKRASE